MYQRIIWADPESSPAWPSKPAFPGKKKLMSLIQMNACQLEKLHYSQGPLWDNPVLRLFGTPLKRWKGRPLLAIRCNWTLGYIYDLLDTSTFVLFKNIYILKFFLHSCWCLVSVILKYSGLYVRCFSEVRWLGPSVLLWDHWQLFQKRCEWMKADSYLFEWSGLPGFYKCLGQ